MRGEYIGEADPPESFCFHCVGFSDDGAVEQGWIVEVDGVFECWKGMVCDVDVFVGSVGGIEIFSFFEGTGRGALDDAFFLEFVK